MDKKRVELELKIIDMEIRIGELERELWPALFPYDREKELADYQRTADSMPQLNTDEKLSYPTKMLLEFLEHIKCEKDRDSLIWRKMVRGD